MSGHETDAQRPPAGKDSPGPVARPNFPAGWRTAVRLRLDVSETGLLSLGADEPKNLVVIGRSLEEVFREFAKFASDCADLGKPFSVLDGVKING